MMFLNSFRGQKTKTSIGCYTRASFEEHFGLEWFYRCHFGMSVCVMYNITYCIWYIYMIYCSILTDIKIFLINRFCDFSSKAFCFLPSSSRLFLPPSQLHYLTLILIPVNPFYFTTSQNNFEQYNFIVPIVHRYM